MDFYVATLGLILFKAFWAYVHSTHVYCVPMMNKHCVRCCVCSSELGIIPAPG